jgi:hypothetical protein
MDLPGGTRKRNSSWLETLMGVSGKDIGALKRNSGMSPD